MIKLGVLGSTRGTALQAVIDAIESNTLNAQIKLVISNKIDALLLERAEQHAIAHLFLDPNGFTRQAYDQLISEQFKQHDIDFILLVGYMRILSDPFIETWRNKIINVHPSLLPKFAGLMDKAVHKAVLDAGVKETGCTIHFVDETVDGGKILIQKHCSVDANDTVDSLKAKVQALEGIAFIDAIQLLSH